MKLKLRDKGLLGRPWLVASIAVSLACAVIMMFCFDYTDGQLTRSWSMQLLDCIFGKTDLDFYHYSEQCMSYDCCDKTIPMMLPISIWNIPVWVLHEITKNAFWADFGGILWMKAGYLVCIILIAVECSKIIKRVNPDSDYLLVYPLIIGSYDILNSTMYACQDEIVYILMLVMALRYLIDGNRKIFMVFATITVSLNPEMIIPVLLMILFCEKNIFKVLLSVIITMVPSAVFSFAVRTNDAYGSHNWVGRAERDSGILKTLFTSDIGLVQKDGNVSLFLITVCLLVFFVYARRDESKDFKDLIWFVGIAMTSMTLLSSGSFMNYFYRSFLYVPFLALVVLSSKNNLHTNLILFLIYTWARGGLNVLNAPIQNISSPYVTIDNEFVRRVFDKSRIVSPGRFINERIPILGNYGMISAVCLTAAILIFYINHRRNQDRQFATFKPKKDILVFVTGLFVPAILALFAYAMVKADHYDKTILFGSAYIQDYYDDAVGYDYHDNNGVSTYPHAILYEDNICLINGEDNNGERIIYADGSSFGPYIKLYPGSYQVIVEGSGLDNSVYDCTYNDSGVPYLIPLEVVASGDGRIIYTFSVDTVTDNVELRFFNTSSGTVVIDNIRIEELS